MIVPVVEDVNPGSKLIKGFAAICRALGLVKGSQLNCSAEKLRQALLGQESASALTHPILFSFDSQEQTFLAHAEESLPCVSALASRSWAWPSVQCGTKQRPYDLHILFAPWGTCCVAFRYKPSYRYLGGGNGVALQRD